jgi:hypothetical protein
MAFATSASSLPLRAPNVAAFTAAVATIGNRAFPAADAAFN